MDTGTFLWIVVILSALALVAAVALRLRAKRRQTAVIAPVKKFAPEPHKLTYKSLQYVETTPFARQSRRLEDQSDEWREKMRRHGQELRGQNIGAIFFAHGTFVGVDPFSLARGVQSIFPRVRHSWINKIHQLSRKQSNLIMKDQANYLPEYIALVEKALGSIIKCQEFHWSSGNHHAARLTGAIDLVERIGKFLLQSGQENTRKILLIGHSHAGQVFALFAQMIEDTALSREILKRASELIDRPVEFYNHLRNCRKLSFDYATFGSPVIYPWPKQSSKRLLNIINHRGHPYLAGRRRGVLLTLDGDYIQQWGTLGSDFIAMTAKERHLNQLLDSILGEGLNRSKWARFRKLRTRVSPYGFTYLVDYADRSSAIPNVLATIFGHGVYTRFEVMEFNMDLICKHLASR